MNTVNNLSNLFINRQIILVISMLFGLSSFAQNTDRASEIIGVWETENKDGKMEFYEENGIYYGKLLWGKDVVNEDGTSKKDLKNPDENLRSENIIGRTTLTELVYDMEEEKYLKGQIYDATSGKTYDCYIELINGQMHMTGYIGFRWLGQTVKWNRLK